MSDVAKVYDAIQEIGSAFEEYKKTCDLRMKAIEEKGEEPAELKEKLEKLDTILDQATEAKERAERALSSMGNGLGNGNGDPDVAMTEYKEALDVYLRTGSGAETLEQKRKEVKALSSMSDPDGGYFLTFDRDPDWVKKITETSPMRQIATVRTIGNASIKGRRRTGLATAGGWVGEGDTRSTTGTPTVGEWEIIAREQYAYPEIPQTLIDDADINVEQWVAGEVVETFAVAENLAFVSGNGVKRPRGFLTYTAGTDPLSDQIEQVTSATNDVMAENDLMELQGKLKEPYQNGASWVMHRLIMTAVRKFTAGTAGGPLWQPGLQLGVPSTILGRPYTLFQDMASAVANAALVMAYGDFRQGYMVVDRRGITTLRDPFTNKGYVGFYTTKRTGGDVVNFEAIKILKIQ